MDKGFDDPRVVEHEESELENRCTRWDVDDPLANHLRGLPLVGLRVGAMLNRRTTALFDELRTEGANSEQLYSFFAFQKGFLNTQIWKDTLPTSGVSWFDGKEVQHGVARYDGILESPSGAAAPRVMDIHNHPEGYPESASAEDTSFFLNDLDMKVQVVVSASGTLIMAKPDGYSQSDFDADEYSRSYMEIGDRYAGDPAMRDKTFTRWVAKKYGIKTYWVKKGTNILLPY